MCWHSCCILPLVVWILACTPALALVAFAKLSVPQKCLGLQKDGLYLYRNILPPKVPGLAFVGSEVSTFNNVLTSGLQAEWLARVLQGEVELPPVEALVADVRRLQQ
jgi:hypothetical protein